MMEERRQQGGDGAVVVNHSFVEGEKSFDDDLLLLFVSN